MDNKPYLVQIKFDECLNLIEKLEAMSDNILKNSRTNSYTVIYEDALYGCGKRYNLTDDFGYEVLLLNYIKENAKDGRIQVEYLSPEKIVIIWEDKTTHIIGRHIFESNGTCFSIIRKADENGEKNGDYYFTIQNRVNSSVAYVIFYYPYALPNQNSVMEGL